MKQFTQEMRCAVKYIEENLTGELNARDIAARAYLSPYYFQRVFHAICGTSLSTYIRQRRLTRAGEMLKSKQVRVIDVAITLGYDSPDSFSRAFQRFHGILPSQVRKNTKLHSIEPIKISDVEEINMLEYRIVDKPAFTVMGLKRVFHGETSYQEIPKFWEEVMRQGKDCPLKGIYGVCLDADGETFDYMIADSYIPWEEIPQGCEVHTIPATTWAIFPCRGALPDALQSVNTQIWKEWVPGNGQWRMAGNFNIELYTPAAAKPEDNYSEIWVPVKKV